MTEITVTGDYDGMRLDRFITKITGAGRNTVQKLLRKGDVRIDGTRVREGDRPVREGESIRIYGVEERSSGAVSFDASLGEPRILYEDEEILAVDKPALLATQPMKGSRDSLSERIKNHLRELIEENGGRFIPAPVNRLDYQTSGIVLCGKTPSSARKLSEMLREEKIEKHYYALCAGEKNSRMRLENWAVRNSAANKMEIVPGRREGAVRMLGIYTPLSSSEGFTLVDAQIITGKTHQIRCQLSEAGLPLVNDVKYGDPEATRRFRKKCQAERILLHCREVAFPLWYAPGSIRITCPLPEDMAEALSLLGIETKDDT